ncbi:hypothetical protein BZG36_05013 [Bifiguratus adelaidae]|uniref:ATP synthase mitochondrial F1 complex assembly factor 1 n=1 Tax=Bifiguratus adelaidae TaxID=1938954 RepID=A0A261XU51_9FUNG|nr:hypothetical protein BZG36_05013 [Bifiguratus adelaidae]
MVTEATKKKIDYEAKYADKLKEMAAKKGVKSVEDLKKQVLATARPKNHELDPVKAANKPAPTTASKAAAAPVAKTAADVGGHMPSSSPTLDKVVRVDLLAKEDAETIRKIWTEYHADKDTVTAVIPSDVYTEMTERAKKYPMFIVPLPMEQGVEFYLLQWNFHQVMFTSLLEYKTRGTEARPYLAITHYPELANDKGIVLMKGEISDDPRILSVANAQYLAFAVQEFYAKKDNEKLDLLKRFHEAPETFSHDEVIRAMEKLA